ncbi:MAG: hypothetical protein ACJAYU_000799 [Bradymonadia bacterium]
MGLRDIYGNERLEVLLFGRDRAELLTWGDEGGREVVEIELSEEIGGWSHSAVDDFDEDGSPGR